MLVLSRKQNEKIVIADNISITVLKVKGNTVRLGIDAPRDVRIVRGELPPKEEESLANVTVVFSGSKENEGAQVDIVPFQNVTERSTRKPAVRPTQHDRLPADNPPSISFKERLPESLQSNRLRQILNEMATK